MATTFRIPGTWARKFGGAALFALVAAHAAGAQTTTPQAAVARVPTPERLQPSLDLAQFQDARHVSFLDLSYAVPLPRAKVAAAANISSPAAELLLDLRIYRDDSLWAAKAWKLEEKKSASAPANSRRELVDRMRYLLSEPGRYRAVLYTHQFSPNDVVDSAEAELQTRKFAENNVEVSDVILASEIKKASAQNPDVAPQSAYEISPNPRQIYGDPVPTLFYYFEAYNLKGGLKSGSYKSYCRVENENGGLVEGLGQPYRTKKKVHDFSVELGSVNVATLPAGVYTLVYGIADSAQNLQVSRRKKFYVYNSAQIAGSSAAGPVEQMLASASEGELDDEFARMQHIVLRDEKKMFEGLTSADAKKKLIASLWEVHKTEEYPNGVTFRMVYLTRAREADARFLTVLRPGWKSDRGRVFILYGPPSNIERVPSNSNTKPYETWRYDDIQGGVIFVFVDRTGFKNYELVHSTHRNELHNADWQSLITFQSNVPGMAQ